MFVIINDTTTNESNQTSHINSATLLSNNFYTNAILLAVIGFVIIFFNMLAVMTFLSAKKIRKKHANVLIFSQSLADIVTGLVFIPVYLLEVFFKKQIILSFIVCYILYLSLFNLLGLALDRLLALWAPLLHHKYVDLPTTLIGIFVVWILPIFLTLTPLSYWFSDLETFVKAHNIYLGVNWCFLMFLCTLLTTVYIILTYKAKQAIKRRTNPSANNASKEQSVKLIRKELRVIHLFGLLLFFFIIAYLPLLYMNFCDFMNLVDYIPDELELVSLYSLVLNSAVNPILCIFLKRDYYQFVRSLFRRLLRRKKKDSKSKSNIKTISITSSYNTSSTFRSKSSRRSRASSCNEVFM